MAGENGAQGGMHGPQSLVTAIRLFHCHEIEPESFEKGIESAGDMAWLIGIGAVANDAFAECEGDGRIFLIIRRAMFLIGGAALTFGPESAPGGQQAGGAYSFVEISSEQTDQLVGRGRSSPGKRLLPIGAIVLGHGFQR